MRKAEIQDLDPGTIVEVRGTGLWASPRRVGLGSGVQLPRSFLGGFARLTGYVRKAEVGYIPKQGLRYRSREGTVYGIRIDASLPDAVHRVLEPADELDGQVWWVESRYIKRAITLDALQAEAEAKSARQAQQLEAREARDAAAQRLAEVLEEAGVSALVLPELGLTRLRVTISVDHAHLLASILESYNPETAS